MGGTRGRFLQLQRHRVLRSAIILQCLCRYHNFEHRKNLETNRISSGMCWAVGMGACSLEDHPTCCYFKMYESLTSKAHATFWWKTSLSLGIWIGVGKLGRSHLDVLPCVGICYASGSLSMKHLYSFSGVYPFGFVAALYVSSLLPNHIHSANRIDAGNGRNMGTHHPLLCW